MIDCSDTEASGIDEAFFDGSVTILYCYWHLWQVWDKNITAKVCFFGRNSHKKKTPIQVFIQAYALQRGQSRAS